jgi:hypothetical protein
MRKCGAEVVRRSHRFVSRRVGAFAWMWRGRNTRGDGCRGTQTRTARFAAQRQRRSTTPDTASLRAAGWCSEPSLRGGGPRPAHAARSLADASIVPLRSASVSVVPLAAAACGPARLEGRRSQACRCSRGRRPSESDSEARDRLGEPPQRHPSGVGDPLTRTPLRRACRPQRPSSPLVAHAHRLPTPPEARYHRPPPCTVAVRPSSGSPGASKQEWALSPLHVR